MNALPIDEMDSIAEKFEGRFGFYVEDLNTGASHGHDADRRFPTASVCKIPVMVELFRQAEEGALDLGERRRLEPTISRHGTGALSMLSDEPELTLNDYARLMIAVSDNGGETWDTRNEVVLRDDGGYPSNLKAGMKGTLKPSPLRWEGDVGYPVSVQLPDDSVLTAYYITESDGITHTAVTRWNP